jgi:uncharacterized membrane protein
MSDKSFDAKFKELDGEITVSKKKYAETVSANKASTGNDVWWSVQNAMTISALVLLFGFAICLLASRLLSKGYSADSILKTFGTVLVIVSAVFLVVAGYSDTQISPVIGLLGTIVGYLLGRNTNEPKV